MWPRPSCLTTPSPSRSGVTHVIFPEANRRDYDELGEELRAGVEASFVKTYDEVFELALGDGSGVAGSSFDGQGAGQ